MLVELQVQRVDGVILLDWSDRSLERQIQFGVRMGEIDADLARFEMNNYRSNIIPVAQFFDQQGLLHIVTCLNVLLRPFFNEPIVFRLRDKGRQARYTTI